MTSHDPQKILAQVTARLAAKHPQLPADRIRQAVAHAYENYRTSVIPDFLGVLVERDAHRQLTST